MYNDQTTRLIVGNNNNKVATTTNNNNQNAVGFNGNNVWPSELSSIISASSTTTSKSILLNNNNLKKLQQNGHNEQQRQHAGLIAQRDYRFESYKATPSTSSSTSSAIIDDEPIIINDSCNKSRKNETNHPLVRPKSEHNLLSHNQQHQINQPLKKSNKWPTTNDLIGTTDELLKNRLFVSINIFKERNFLNSIEMIKS